MKSFSKNGTIITNQQFGQKAGKHAIDFGFEPNSEADRNKILDIIIDIVDNNDYIKEGEWRSQSSKVIFYIKGEDVVVVSSENEYITILKGGINNARVKNARRK